MSSIRVTYSGLISFLIGFISLITGLVFTVIFTRSLSPEEFGTWGIIGTLTGYVILTNPLISYWVTREIARGEESGKTAIQTSFLFSVIAIIIYIGIAFFFSNQTEIDPFLLFFAILLIPTQFFHNTLTHISIAHKPHLAEFGLIIFELIKIPLALVLVYYEGMGITGAIITISASYVISSIFLTIKNRKKLKGKFKKEFLIKWMKLFWIPTYPKISAIFTRSDVAVFTLMTGSVSAIAYWTSANAVSRIIKHSSKINRAVYPKLLSGGRKEIFQENITRVLYFAFPLIGMTIIFAKPGLYILNPLYIEVEILVFILSPLIFLRVINSMCTQALSGIEKVDKNKMSTFTDYAKSKLFYIPTLENIHRGIYFGILVLVLFLVSKNHSDLELLNFWAIISIFVQLPFTIYLMIWVRKEFKPKIDFNTIFKYVFSSILVFGGIGYLVNQNMEYSTSIFEFVWIFSPYLIGSGILYVGITYLIDNKTRKLVKSIINELIKRK